MIVISRAASNALAPQLVRVGGGGGGGGVGPPPPPPHVSRARGIVKVRVRIPAILNFFKLSFRNCISRVFYCDDPNISFISSLRGSKI